MYAAAEGEWVRKEEGAGETGGEVERREGGRRCWGKQEGGRGSLGSSLRGICAYRVGNVDAAREGEEEVVGEVKEEEGRGEVGASLGKAG